MNKSASSSIKQSVKSSIRQYFWERESQPSFVMGVSGGVDSMSLMHIFSQLEIETFVVHINYGMRGAASDGDARLVQKQADAYGFSCKMLKVDPDEAKDRNFQQWAREKRYEVFRQTKNDAGLAGIALAHHRDDQIETILQKIFRGAGLASWSAMQEWNGELFRPMLGFSKQQIRCYAEQENIPYRTDESNLGSDYARNFLRNKWLVELNEHFPGWEQNVLRISEQADIFSEALEWIIAKITDDRERIHRKPLLEMPPDLMKTAVLYQLKNIDADASIGKGALEQLTKLRQLQTGKRLQLTEEFFILRDRAWFQIMDSGNENFISVTLKREEVENEQCIINDIGFEVGFYEHPDFAYHLYLDAQKLCWPLTIRSWKSADKFQPLGMEGHQTVADHLANRKITALHKSQALVLETADQVICAVLFPPEEQRTPPGSISEWVKCRPESHKKLLIKHVN